MVGKFTEIEIVNAESSYIKRRLTQVSEAQVWLLYPYRRVPVAIVHLWMTLPEGSKDPSK